jgi:uncharacterized protein YodC (DUF2158 family)
MKVGDLVELKSGGPKMTVSLLDNGEAHCVWFDHDHNERRGKYPEGSLKEAEDDDGPIELLIG